MNTPLLLIWCELALSMAGSASELKPALIDGVVSFAPDGGDRRTINVGKRCTDLWVSPDQTVLAFIGVDKETVPAPNPLLSSVEEPQIEESSIYVARRSTGLIPVRLSIGPIAIEERSWLVLREPSVAPDGTDVFFSVPYSETSSKVFRFSLNSGALAAIADATAYCVVWGGDYSGYLLLEQRYLPPDGDKGVIYQGWLRAPSGATTRIAADLDGIDAFEEHWSAQHGGACPFSLDHLEP